MTINFRRVLTPDFFVGSGVPLLLAVDYATRGYWIGAAIWGAVAATGAWLIVPTRKPTPVVNVATLTAAIAAEVPDLSAPEAVAHRVHGRLISAGRTGARRG